MLRAHRELFHDKAMAFMGGVYWNILNEFGVLEDISIPCTYASLEQTSPLRNGGASPQYAYNVYGENTVEVGRRRPISRLFRHQHGIPQRGGTGYGKGSCAE